MYSGFRERAQAVKAMMRSPDVGFMVLSGAELSSVEEGLFFADRLLAEAMPLAGYIVNRVRVQGVALDVSSSDVRSKLTESLTNAGASYVSTAKILDTLQGCVEQSRRIAARDQAQCDRVQRRLAPLLVLSVPDFAEDIHDLGGLYRYGQHLVVANGSGE